MERHPARRGPRTSEGGAGVRQAPPWTSSVGARPWMRAPGFAAGEAAAPMADIANPGGHPMWVRRPEAHALPGNPTKCWGSPSATHVGRSTWNTLRPSQGPPGDRVATPGSRRHVPPTVPRRTRCCPPRTAGGASSPAPRSRKHALPTHPTNHRPRTGPEPTRRPPRPPAQFPPPRPMPSCSTWNTLRPLPGRLAEQATRPRFRRHAPPTPTNHPPDRPAPHHAQLFHVEHTRSLHPAGPLSTCSTRGHKALPRPCEPPATPVNRRAGATVDGPTSTCHHEADVPHGTSGLPPVPRGTATPNPQRQMLTRRPRQRSAGSRATRVQPHGEGALVRGATSCTTQSTADPRGPRSNVRRHPRSAAPAPPVLRPRRIDEWSSCSTWNKVGAAGSRLDEAPNVMAPTRRTHRSRRIRPLLTPLENPAPGPPPTCSPFPPSDASGPATSVSLLFHVEQTAGCMQLPLLRPQLGRPVLANTSAPGPGPAPEVVTQQHWWGRDDTDADAPDDSHGKRLTVVARGFATRATLRTERS